MKEKNLKNELKYTSFSNIENRYHYDNTNVVRNFICFHCKCANGRRWCRAGIVDALTGALPKAGGSYARRSDV